jgi:hypothetical protein
MWTKAIEYNLKDTNRYINNLIMENHSCTLGQKIINIIETETCELRNTHKQK